MTYDKRLHPDGTWTVFRSDPGDSRCREWVVADRMTEGEANILIVLMTRLDAMEERCPPVT